MDSQALNPPTHTTAWIGQSDKSIVMSMGDFGAVRANFKADLFNTKTGFMVKIYSCKLELFGGHVEFLHRLTGDAKTFVESQYLSECNKLYWIDADYDYI